MPCRPEGLELTYHCACLCLLPRTTLRLSKQRTALSLIESVIWEPASDCKQACWSVLRVDTHVSLEAVLEAVDVSSTCDSMLGDALNCFGRQCCEFEESWTSCYKIRNGVNMGNYSPRPTSERLLTKSDVFLWEVALINKVLQKFAILGEYSFIHICFLY